MHYGLFTSDYLCKTHKGSVDCHSETENGWVQISCFFSKDHKKIVCKDFDGTLETCLLNDDDEVACTNSATNKEVNCLYDYSFFFDTTFQCKASTININCEKSWRDKHKCFNKPAQEVDLPQLEQWSLMSHTLFLLIDTH